MFSTSRDTLSAADPDYLNDEELVKLVEDLKKKVQILRLENEVLEQTILRVQPSLMDTVTKTLEYAIKLHSGLTVSTSKFHPWKTESLSKIMSPDRGTSTVKVTSSGKVASSGKMSSLGRILSTGKTASSIKQVPSLITTASVIGGQGPKVNVEEKQELVDKLMELQDNALDKCKTNAKKKKAFLTAQFEEIDIRMNDIGKLVVDFNQQVIVDGYDPIGRRIPAEIWIRFMTEQSKKKDRLMDKLRIRVSTLNSRFSRLREDIKRKEDLRSLLFPIDFEEKKIEIKQNLKIIDFKNEQLVALKEVTGDANLCLTVHKDKMMAMEKYLDQIINLTNLRKQQTKKVRAQKSVMQIQIDFLELRVRDIKKVRERYFVPDVNEYVAVKSRLHGLVHDIQILETRLKIKQFDIANLKQRKKREMKVAMSEKSDDMLLF